MTSQIANATIIGIVCGLLCTFSTSTLFAQPASPGVVGKLNKYHAQLVGAANKAKKSCATGIRTACLHAEVLDASVLQLARAISIADQPFRTRLEDSSPEEREYRDLLEKAGFNQKVGSTTISLDCWRNGGVACQKVYDALQSKGLKAVGSSWGRYVVREVTTGQIGHPGDLNVPQ